MQMLIRDVRIVDGGSVFAGSILAEDGKIAAILPPDARAEGAETVEGGGLYASAGFIDCHTHGAGGHDFMDGTVEAFLGACRMHLSHGTTTILPTTLSASTGELVRSIAAFKEARALMAQEQCQPGMHLEGPYFAMNQKGGQDPRYIRDPDPAEYRRIVELADGAIVRWSIAPERHGAMEMGDYLTAHGIWPTIGHTDATYDDCVEALRHGYTHITHLYSCTSTITRRGGFRILGVTESAYALDGLTVEVIADGCHLPPELLRMIVKCKGVDRVIMVTDSLRPAGLDVRTAISGSREDGQVCIIEDGVAKLPDRSAFAGSIATADRLVRTMWKRAGVPLPDVIRMMCENPARLLHLEGRKGRLLSGHDADIVLFDEDVRVHGVYYAGRRVS
ncbi:MAG TPA: N-acetylglucosamine-6-phosphate deacetylase [Candidatus Aphodomorpha intestinavium]|uniref:N-acetylglucosamine-6-phosphate deacetylase n=1 Tax=Candidatus Aphodomorpha intestinavium TaxID=2840672 RepID=A0A9D1SSI8_9FIRM|nr:N-acetylglucosamine-6-phosphate deacetylase [Candidatus Aphodomorpha intestinavium]